MRGSYSIVILPPDGSKVTSFKLGKRTVWIILVLGGLFLVFLSWVGLSYSRLWARSQRLNEVMEENQRLRLTQERIRLMERDLKDISLFRRRLSLLLGYPSQPEADPPLLGNGRLAANLPLIWPVDGWITAKPCQVGLEIFVPQGSPIKSTGDGIVNFAGWRKNLGKTLIIDHGNGYVTVYGHNSALLAPVGERVKRGAVVALSGGGPFPHLYYGVRRNGVEVDPRELLVR